MIGDAHVECWINVLTHPGRVTHICVSNLTIIGSYNGLSSGRRNAKLLSEQNAAILLIGTLGTNRNSYIFIQENASEYIVWTMAAILSRPQYVKPVNPIPYAVHPKNYARGSWYAVYCCAQADFTHILQRYSSGIETIMILSAMPQSSYFSNLCKQRRKQIDNCGSFVFSTNFYRQSTNLRTDFHWLLSW